MTAAIADKWFSVDDAVELTCNAHKISAGAAIKSLISAFANSVRTRQRMPFDGHSIAIPMAVWRDAHFDFDTGELYPAGTDLYHPPTEEGGYGHGGNGIIEVNEADLRDRLCKPAPKKRGRPPKFDWDGDIKQRAFAFLNYHGAPNAADREWGTQAALEKAIVESGVDVAPSTVRKYASGFIAEWKAEKAKRAGN